MCGHLAKVNVRCFALGYVRSVVNYSFVVKGNGGPWEGEGGCHAQSHQLHSVGRLRAMEAGNQPKGAAGNGHAHSDPMSIGKHWLD